MSKVLTSGSLVLEQSSLETVEKLGMAVGKLTVGFNRLLHKRTKVTCACGTKLRRDGLAAHIRCDKHKRWLAGKKFDRKAHAKAEKICPRCQTVTSNKNFKQHQKSKRCRAAA